MPVGDPFLDTVKEVMTHELAHQYFFNFSSASPDLLMLGSLKALPSMRQREPVNTETGPRSTA